MKLLILATYYLPETNAQSYRIFQIVKRFQKKSEVLRIRIAVFNPKYSDEYSNNRNIDSVEIQRYYNNKFIPYYFFMPQSLNPITLIFWIYIILKEQARFDPDFILTTSPPFTPTIAIYIISKIYKKFTYMVDYRDDLTSVIDSIAGKKRLPARLILQTLNILMSKLLFLSMKNSSIVSTVNKSLQQKLLKINRNVLLLPNGIDIEELDDLRKSFNKEIVLKKNGINNTKSNIIIFIGDLDMPYYMPEAIFDALKKLQNEGYNLNYIIIGGGSRKLILEKLVRELNLNESVFLLGWKKHTDAMELLLASDIALYAIAKDHPQKKHAIATKINEYVGCKLPILAIADKDSAISEFIITTGIGVSLDWKEFGEIKDAIERILKSPEYKYNLDKKFKELIKEFNGNAEIDLLYINIKKVLAARKQLE